MKNKDSKLNATKIIGICFSFAAIALCCCLGGEKRRSYNNNPKYLISGDKLQNQPAGDYEYYLINEGANAGTYAVGLTENAKGKTTVQAFPKRYPDTNQGILVTGIWRDGFANAALTSIDLRGSNLAVIDYEAFMGCTALTSITIPYTVNKIGEAAFYNCIAMTNARFDNDSNATSASNTSACVCGEPESGGVAIPTNLTKIPDFCFYNCYNLTDIVLNSKITDIEHEAFNGCANLKSTIAFQSIKNIRARAFQGCESLTKIYIQNSFFTDETKGVIEPYAFAHCGENLTIYFSAEQGDINDWLAIGTNSSWGLKNELNHTQKYGYTKVSASSEFSGDWEFTSTPAEEQGKYDVTITKYIGPLTLDNGDPVTYITVPTHLPIGDSDYNVRYISPDTFDSDNNVLKANLQRLYLPTTLRRIEEFMFDETFTALKIIDDNSSDACSNDKTNYPNITSRIKLNNITSLEVIGDFAFLFMPKFSVLYNGTPAADSVKELYLPYSLKAVGNAVFGSSREDYSFNRVKNGKTISVKITARHSKSLTKFVWDYDEEKSQLVAIGFDAFFKLGSKDSGKNVKSSSDTKPQPMIANTSSNNTTAKLFHSANRIILPRTFRHTGFTEAEATEFGVRTYKNANKLKGEHVFAGCPLINEVYIKGSTQAAVNTYIAAGQSAVKDPNVTDLILGVQTFANCDCLQKIVIEERVGHEIFFHTNNGRWGGEPCIGWNSGRLQNDFSSDPFLQILVLPTKYTKLVIQEYAFQANSRATIYLSGTTDNLYANMTVGNTAGIEDIKESVYNLSTFISYNGQTPKTVNDLYYWNLIGDETTVGDTVDTYSGFYLPIEKSGQPQTNHFGINQKIPIYTNVHYEIDLNGDDNITDADVSVGVSCANDLVITAESGTDFDGNSTSFDKYAFVCNNSSSTATLSKYLYDRHNKTFSGTARVPASVNNYAGTKCSVTKIGDSAFSTAYCDEVIHNAIFKINSTNGFKDLTAVEVPDTIQEIGEYAFFRAYGVTSLTAYSVSNGAFSSLRNTYTMPSALGTDVGHANIGKHAFAFCNIVQFLDIPDTCLLYESTSAYTTAGNYQVTSVFSNNFSLRKITFAPANNEDTDNTSSSYYETTTYKHGNADGEANKYTCALYEKNATAVNRKLLLVLNRDSNDEYNSEDATVTGGTIEFNGLYGQSPYLYGAYKMGYWIESLVLGKPTENGSGNPIAQPLFSGIDTTVTNRRLYLYATNKTTNLFNPNNYKYSGYSKLTAASLSDTITVKFQQYAFNGCNSLTKIKLPRNTTLKIPDGIFSTTNIKKFITPIDNNNTYAAENTYVDGTMNLQYTGYTGIGQDAFNGVSNIKEFIAPDVTNFEVDARAFQNCTNLHTINFEHVSGKVTIKANAFEGCTALKTIKFKEGCQVEIQSSAFKSAAMNTDGTGFTWPTTANISFGASAFEGFNFKSGSFEIPGRITSVGNNCFKNCTSLTSITAATGFSLTSMGTYVFSGCTGLTSVDLTSFSSLTSLSNGFFSGCTNLASITSTLPTSITSFGNYAFEGTKFTSFDFDKFREVTTIGTGCFKNCTSLATVNSTYEATDPTKVTTIGESAFEGCTALNGFDFDDFTKLTTIGDKAFYTEGDTHPTICASGIVNLPATLTSIGSQAFQNSAITRVNVYSTGTLTINASAFKDCTSLEVFYFMEGDCLLKISGVDQFNGCISLTELWIPYNTGSGNFNVNSNSNSIIMNCYYTEGSAKKTNIVIYTHQTFTTSRQQAWRYYYGQQYAPIAYYAPNTTDLLNGTSGNYTLKTSNTDYFWTFDNGGNVVKLGYAVSVESDGTVHFNNNGTLHTLTIAGVLA